VRVVIPIPLQHSKPVGQLPECPFVRLILTPVPGSQLLGWLPSLPGFAIGNQM